MSIYLVDGHPLLSTAAAALEADALEEQALLAEDLLGLAGTAFDGANAVKAARAVALQVSYQVERGIEGSVYQNLERGSRRFTYRDQGLVHPIALELVTAILSATETASVTPWPAITGYR